MVTKKRCKCGCGEKISALPGVEYVDGHEPSSTDIADMIIPEQGPADFWDDDRGWHTWPGNDS